MYIAKNLFFTQISIIIIRSGFRAGRQPLLVKTKKREFEHTHDVDDGGQ